MRIWESILHRNMTQRHPSKDTMCSKPIQEQLALVSASLQSSQNLLGKIAMQLERLEQELWVQDSQELC